MKNFVFLIRIKLFKIQKNKILIYYNKKNTNNGNIYQRLCKNIIKIT